MFKKKKILALIIARKNSKGLRNKHLLQLGKRKIIEWSFYSTSKSKFIDKIILSTDCRKIISLSKKFRVNAPFIRPSNLSSDNSKIKDVINHTKNFLKYNDKKKYDLLVLLQGSSPFRQAYHIDGAIKLFIKNQKKIQTLISGFRISKKFNWIMSKNKKFIKFKLRNKMSDLRRQNCKDIYLPNGAIYISKYNKKLKSFYTQKTILYEMHENSSVDIDTEQDLKIARRLSISKQKF